MSEFAALVLVAGLALRLGAGPAAAQAPQANQAPAAAVDHQDEGDPQAIFRAPLLREGSAIIDARARIQRDATRGWWQLIVDGGGESRELILLPCTRLTEMQRITEASPERLVRFQVSGRVFVYRGRNYVLPTHAPVIEEPPTPLPTEEPKPGQSEAPASTDPAKPGQSEAPPGVDAAGDSPPHQRPSDTAADIMRDLERAAGPARRSPASPTATAPRRQPEEAAPAREDLLPEETSVVNRRGKITRDAAGGWMFIFDADASGLSDPPLRLLPCLLLERIEDYARRQGHNSPALLSGTVYLYNGQNYLLPTVFRIPQERRNIMP